MANEEPKPDGKGTDSEYISELRTEAATWRKKFRETEQALATYQQAEQDFAVNEKISKELTKRGVQDVEPTWVDLDEGQEAADAVDAFLESHPRFKVAPQEEEVLPKRGATTKPIIHNNSNTNTPSIGPVKDILKIKEDPIARAKMRDMYRGLLAQQSNTGLTI